MAENKTKKVLITDTILRDAHQSQAATRMRIDEMIPVLSQLDDIGYYSLEAWGGAHLRQLPPLFERGSVGKIENAEKVSQKNAHSNASERSEPFGLPSLF